MSEGFPAFRILLHYLKIRSFANHSDLKINTWCLNLKNHWDCCLEPFWTSVKEAEWREKEMLKMGFGVGFAEDRGCCGEGSNVSPEQLVELVVDWVPRGGQTFLAIWSLGSWRKTRLRTVSATGSLLSAVTLGGKVTAESSDTAVSPVTRGQLQKCRLLRGCHVLFPLQERLLELEEKI